MREILRRVSLGLDAEAVARRVDVMVAGLGGAIRVRQDAGARVEPETATVGTVGASLDGEAGDGWGSLGLLARLGFRPRHCVWELTLACELRCAHCCSTAGRSRPGELSTQEALQVARQIADAGCAGVALSGGEPTLRADWDLIAEALAELGVRVGLATNGWSWSTDHTRRAVDAGLHGVTFSLDGLEDAHDTLRRAPGSFARVLAAIDDCVARGLSVGVNTQISQFNKRTLDKVRDLLADHGVSSWRIGVANPVGAMSERRYLAIPDRDLLWLVPEIADMKRSSSPSPQIHPTDNLGYYGIHETVLRDQGSMISFWLGCRAGCQVVGIRSNGDVTGCLSLPSHGRVAGAYVEGNLRRGSLREIWARRNAFARTRSFDVSKLKGFCGSCRFGDICRGGCPQAALSRTGSLYDNPLCFYRQAVEHRRWDLIADGDVDRAAAVRRGQASRRAR